MPNCQNRPQILSILKANRGTIILILILTLIQRIHKSWIKVGWRNRRKIVIIKENISVLLVHNSIQLCIWYTIIQYPIVHVSVGVCVHGNFKINRRILPSCNKCFSADNSFVNICCVSTVFWKVPECVVKV